MGYNGIDLFRPDPGVMESCKCKACGSDMNVKRNIPSACSWAGAMAGLNRKHDLFTCPESDKNWHKQVVSLIIEQQQTKSSKLTKILQEEIDEILLNKKPTK